MALKTTLSRFAEAVTGAVHDFAAAEGWSRTDYVITATFDRETERVYMHVGSIRPIDRIHWFKGIINQLSIAFGSRSQAMNHVNLVVEQLDRLDQIFDSYILNENEIELTDLVH